MRIFTLGKNGIPLFFFALFLFSGTYSYGQNVCGVVDQNTATPGVQQYFCDSQEAELNDLLIEGNNISFFSSNGSPLDGTTLLANGAVYTVDVDGCRTSVEVTVYNEPQILGINETTKQSSGLGSILICVPDESNPDVQVADLRTNVSPEMVVWFYSLTATGDKIPVENPSETELIDNAFYYAAVENPYTGCVTNTAEVRVRLNSEAAPTGPATQEFCAVDNPTLTDIEASGDNRFYTSATSGVELSRNTLLEDGKTYFISSVGELCESQQRLAVTVTVTEPTDLGTPEPGIVCELDVDQTFPDEEAIKNFFLDLLGDNVPTNGSFNPTPEQVARAYRNDSDGLGDFTTTYRVGCDSVELTARIVAAEPATVNPIEDNSICASGEGFDLSAYIAGNTTGGTFTSTNGMITGNVLDVSEAGTYNITYTVSESDPTTCLTGTASETFTVTVGQNNSIPVETIEIALCEAEVDAFLANPESAAAYFNSVLAENGINDFSGTFDPSLEAIYAQWMENPIGTFETTYTIGEEGCQDSVDIVINVTEGGVEAPEAGIVCETDTEAIFPDFPSIRNFYRNLLDPSIPRNGTFNPTAEQIRAEYRADADGLGDFTTTYTFGPGACDQVDLTIRVVPAEQATVEPIEDVAVCTSEEALDLSAYLSENTTPGGSFTSENGNIIDGMLEISTEGTYTITYTVDESDPTTCLTGTASETFTVTVGQNNSIPVETIEIALCEAEVDAFLANPESAAAYFSSVLAENGINDFSGTFVPSLEAIYAQWMENPIGTFETTYTVGEEGCQDSVDIVINVTEGGVEAPEAGIVCETDTEAIFPDFPSIRNFYRNLLDPSIPRNGTFNPTAQEIRAMYRADADGLGDFTTTYTFGPGACDQVDLTIRVVPAEKATVEPIEDLAVCTSEEALDLNAEITNATGGGTFTYTASGEVIANGLLDVSSEGEIGITYTVAEADQSSCLTGSASTNFTVNVTNEAVEAVVEDIADFTTCVSGEIIELSSLLGANTTTGGTFTVDGTTATSFDPSVGVGTYEVVYSVDGDDRSCVVGEASDSFTITVTDEESEAIVEDIANVSTCVSGEIITLSSLLGTNTTTGGTFTVDGTTATTFDPSMGVGTYEVTYTVDGDDLACVVGEASDSFTITVTDEETEAIVEDIADFSTCVSGEIVALSSLLGANTTTGGTFTVNGTTATTFDPSMGVGTYEVTYTVDGDELACVVGEASDSFVITVTDDGFNAGADNSTTVCNSAVEGRSAAAIRNLYLGLLEDGVARTGTFNPTIEQLIEQYNLQERAGEFTTVYTLGTGSCADSAELTITVLESLDAGEDATVVLEEDATEVVDLFEALGGTPDAGGIFTFGGQEVDAEFDPATDPEGRYTYTVRSENGCADSAVVTVQVGEPVACPEVTEPTQSFCSGATVADLLPTNALWYESADGMTPLSDDTVLIDGGEYFAGDPEAECETRDMVTVTIIDAPAAPVVTDFDGCVVTGATVADLDITAADGNTVQVFTDAALQTPVTDTEVLVEGTYYVTQTTAEGCVSEAATIAVTLSDTTAPTLTQGGNEFCEFDNATVADLEANVDATGEIVWYTTATGMETFSPADVLENNVTYFAAVVDEASGCESSQRLSVTVILKACELVIPEIFTPNGDGINDTFVIDGLADQYPDFKIMVYNRWGEPVYVGNAGTPDWNGYSNQGSFADGLLPTGVYFYILYYNDGETTPTQGKVYLSI